MLESAMEDYDEENTFAQQEDTGIKMEQCYIDGKILTDFS